MPMPLSLAPGYAKLTYSGVLFPHHMTIPIKFDGTPTPGTNPDLLTKGATTVDAETGIGNFVEVLRPFFNADTHFGLCEIHKVNATTGEDTFIYAFDVGLVGSASGENVPTAQAVITFKTTGGGLYRLYMMEGNQGVNVKLYPPFSAGLLDDLSDFVVGAGSIVYGRDNTYPFTPIAFITKINDKLRKQQGLA